LDGDGEADVDVERGRPLQWERARVMPAPAPAERCVPILGTWRRREMVDCIVREVYGGVVVVGCVT
jgi:hypothetical protein